MKDWLKVPKQKKKRKEKDTLFEDSIKLGVSMVGVGIGLGVLKEVLD